MKQTLTCLIALMLTCSAFALIMGEKSYRIEVSKADDGTILLDVINLREFKSVQQAAEWCYETHKRTEGREVWYGNTVDLDFTAGFSDAEIEEICYGFIREKVYPHRVRFIEKESIETKIYRPGFLGHAPNKSEG